MRRQRARRLRFISPLPDLLRHISRRMVLSLSSNHCPLRTLSLRSLSIRLPSHSSSLFTHVSPQKNSPKRLSDDGREVNRACNVQSSNSETHLLGQNPGKLSAVHFLLVLRHIRHGRQRPGNPASLQANERGLFESHLHPPRPLWPPYLMKSAHKHCTSTREWVPDWLTCVCRTLETTSTSRLNLGSCWRHRESWYHCVLCGAFTRCEEDTHFHSRCSFPVLQDGPICVNARRRYRQAGNSKPGESITQFSSVAPSWSEYTTAAWIRVFCAAQPFFFLFLNVWCPPRTPQAHSTFVFHCMPRRNDHARRSIHCGQSLTLSTLPRYFKISNVMVVCPRFWKHVVIHGSSERQSMPIAHAIRVAKVSLSPCTPCMRQVNHVKVPNDLCSPDIQNWRALLPDPTVHTEVHT